LRLAAASWVRTSICRANDRFDRLLASLCQREDIDAELLESFTLEPQLARGLLLHALSPFERRGEGPRIYDEWTDPFPSLARAPDRGVITAPGALQIFLDTYFSESVKFGRPFLSRSSPPPQKGPTSHEP
jgi:hypothetical protein